MFATRETAYARRTRTVLRGVGVRAREGHRIAACASDIEGAGQRLLVDESEAEFNGAPPRHAQGYRADLGPRTEPGAHRAVEPAANPRRLDWLPSPWSSLTRAKPSAPTMRARRLSSGVVLTTYGRGSPRPLLAGQAKDLRITTLAAYR